MMRLTIPAVKLAYTEHNETALVSWPIVDLSDTVGRLPKASKNKHSLAVEMRLAIAVRRKEPNSTSI